MLSKCAEGGEKMAKLIAVASCPSGVAHSYMAAESITRAAKRLGMEVKVEIQGAVGIENALTPADVATADFVLLTSDTAIRGEERFANKIVLKKRASQIIREPDRVLKELIAMAQGKSL
jgi:fructose-specific phosphotransferase system IIB component